MDQTNGSNQGIKFIQSYPIQDRTKLHKKNGQSDLPVSNHVIRNYTKLQRCFFVAWVIKYRSDWNSEITIFVKLNMTCHTHKINF